MVYVFCKYLSEQRSSHLNQSTDMKSIHKT